MRPRSMRPGVLLLWTTALLALGYHPAAHAQPVVHLHGTVVDSSGKKLSGVLVVARWKSGSASAATDDRGRFTLDYPGAPLLTLIRATAARLESDTMQVGPQAPPRDLVLTLHPTSIREEITVTATRSALDLPPAAATVYALDARKLQDYPATALDDKLRQQAGFELFRRASSTTANPTSQGVSLRGLGSTAVSRTLVLENSVPVNDPFGGWIHWDAIPAQAIDGVDVATGGGSDLYGSSAMGGVVDIIPSRPTSGRFNASAFGGGQDTSLLSARVDLGSGRWRQLFAGDSFRNAGYLLPPPALVGTADTPADLHYQNSRSETDYVDGDASRVFLIGDLLNEARNNGARLQTNGTRLWRYIAGDDWAAGKRAGGRARLFGSDEAYRQSFSSVNPTRTTENLTRLQHVRTQELGASADASFALGATAIVTGFDTRDIRATDDETPISFGSAAGVADTSARQRFFGAFGELVGSRGHWSAAASLRVDRTWNLDTRTITLPSSLPQPVLAPGRSEVIPSPRLGIVRALGSAASAHASVFRAFRTPSMNELYRTGQVGQEITQANTQLTSERATGWDAGADFALPNKALALQATYFWTQINRPVSAVLTSSTPTSILERRENLGQILSQGTELHLDIRPHDALSGSLGYQYAHAVITRFSAQPSLIGNSIPQVPRHSFTAQLHAQNASLGELTVAARASGHTYDDSQNTYVLNSFFQLDILLQRAFGTHWSASLSVQNLLNDRADVARTPILTLGSPLLAQGGVAFHWSRPRPI